MSTRDILRAAVDAGPDIDRNVKAHGGGVGVGGSGCVGVGGVGVGVGVVILVLVVYIPGLLVMYIHMLTQRNRAYSKTKIKNTCSRMRQEKNENWQEAIVC